MGVIDSNLLPVVLSQLSTRNTGTARGLFSFYVVA
jgi:hypothetical protein